MLYEVNFIKDARTISTYVVRGSSEKDAVARALDKSYIREIYKDSLEKIIIQAQEIELEY